MIKTTVVGSYPTPLWLRVFSNRDSLRDAMLAVLKTQELAGIDVVADGELYRWDINHAETNGMIDYFVKPLAGIESRLTAAQIERWRSGGKTPFRSAPPGVVTGPIGPGTLHLKADYELFRDLTPLPKKFTVTSPYMLARTLVDGYYHDAGRLAMALAEVLREQVRGIDAAVLQVDEAHLPGHPEDAKLAAEVINVVLDGFQGERAVHLCFGNYGGQTVQQGAYAGLLEFLNGLSAQHVVLEMARRPKADLDALRDVKPELKLGIGVIDVKDNEVESPADVARRIEEAAGRLSAQRIAWVHPDCGFWMLPRSVADAKMRSLVAGRDLFEGRPPRVA